MRDVPSFAMAQVGLRRRPTIGESTRPLGSTRHCIPSEAKPSAVPPPPARRFGGASSADAANPRDRSYTTGLGTRRRTLSWIEGWPRSQGRGELVRRRRMDGNTSSIRQEHSGDAWRAAIQANRGFVRAGAKGNVLHGPAPDDTILLRAGLHVVARGEAGLRGSDGAVDRRMLSAPDGRTAEFRARRGTVLQTLGKRRPGRWRGAREASNGHRFPTIPSRAAVLARRPRACVRSMGIEQAAALGARSLNTLAELSAGLRCTSERCIADEINAPSP